MEENTALELHRTWSTAQVFKSSLRDVLAKMPDGKSPLKSPGGSTQAEKHFVEDFNSEKKAGGHIDKLSLT